MLFSLHHQKRRSILSPNNSSSSSSWDFFEGELTLHGVAVGSSSNRKEKYRLHATSWAPAPCPLGRQIILKKKQKPHPGRQQKCLWPNSCLPRTREPPLVDPYPIRPSSSFLTAPPPFAPTGCSPASRSGLFLRE